MLRGRLRNSLIVLAGAGIVFYAQTLAPPTFEEVRAAHAPSDVWILDRDGKPLDTLRQDLSRRSLDWTPSVDFSPALKELLIAAEDRRFHSHPGIDALALLSSLSSGARGQGMRGASTLTMQVVRLLAGKSPSRGILTKIDQMARAVRLEFTWNKEQILEAYLNLAPFRGEIVGIRAAALGFFEKSPRDLHPEESALLVALLRAPNAPFSRVAARACTLLKSESCESVARTAEAKLVQTAFSQRTRAILPVFAEQIRSPTHAQEPGTVRTTLAREIQLLAAQALGEQLEELRARNVRDGAVLVLENATGNALAYVANGGWERSSSVAVDGIQALRQAGSTLKPFIYATGIERRIFDLSTLLLDSPENITVAFGRVYQPKNYDHTFRGRVSVAEALGSSLNVPAVRALSLAGESETLDRLKALGLRALKSEEDYGPSLALGSVDLTLWDLTHAYRRLQTDDSPFSVRTREAIFAALSGPEYRRFTFGTESALKLPFPAAVKTGTSKDMRDNWCVGYSDRYTVGVWIGNFDGAPMHGVSGMSGAAPVWRRLMLALHERREGTLPRYEKPEEALERPSLSKIKYPAPDMLVGLDPDIPQEMQRMPIEIEHPLAGQKLFMNGKALGSAQEATLFPIRKRGEYVVELRDPKGQTLDQVRFFVR